MAIRDREDNDPMIHRQSRWVALFLSHAKVALNLIRTGP